MSTERYTPHERTLLLDRWTAALRSETYAQAANQLRADTDFGIGYCCLGVLCEIDPNVTLDDYENYVFAEESNNTALPYSYARALDITDIGALDVHKPNELPIWLDSYFKELGGHRINLANLNDDTAATFDEIATIIDMARANDIIGFTSFADGPQEDE